MQNDTDPDTTPATRGDGTPIAKLQHRVSPEEEQQIIQMKLARVSHGQICTELNRNPRTIQRVWNKHLDRIAKEKAGQNERSRIEALQRLDQIAVDARHGAIRARQEKKANDERQWLQLEEKTIMEMARLEGLQVNKVEVSGQVGVVAVHITERVDYNDPQVIDV